jgi:formate dehydrogenase alpha subunit
MTNSVDELEDADCIFVTGSNTTSSHPLVATRIFRAKEKGAKLIVADPRKIHLASMADIYVSQNLGTDVALLNGIMHVILERGWHDQAFIEERTEGFEDFFKVIEHYSPDKVAEITGVAAEDIIKIAEMYGTAKAASIVYCMGITQHTSGVDNVKSLANLAMLTGNMGKESTGVNPLRGQNNVQGACDMGSLPNVYPGYQAVTMLDIKEKFESAWNAQLSDKVGLTIPHMLSGLLEGSVKALFVVGENPMMSDPDVNHVEKALKSAELLVVQDIFFTPTAEFAHVVLPGTSFAEKNGTFTNTERRVLRIRQAINRFGYPMDYESPEAIMREIASVTPSYGGISFDRLEGEGLQWPCPNPEHPGTKFLHKDKFVRGKGLFHGVEHQPPAEVVDEEYPLWLTTGRIHVHYHTGTMTRNSPSLNAEVSEGYLEMNPADAGQMGVSQGDSVKVTSRRGDITAKTMVTERVREGMVFMPFHFVESNANVLTNPAHDPIVRIPEFKVCAVKVERA